MNTEGVQKRWLPTKTDKNQQNNENQLETAIELIYPEKKQQII